MNFALQGAFEWAMLCIVTACVLDGLDGRVARKLGISSNFGAQLDSLCDAITCGVAPAFVLLMWRFTDMNWLGSIAIMFYVLCIVMRLARFNSVALDEKNSTKSKKNYFVGLAAPSAAILLLLPMMLQIGGWGNNYQLIFINDINLIFYVILIAYLAISRFKTPSIKGLKAPFLLLLILSIFWNPWLVLPIICGVVIIYIPVYNLLDFYKKV